MSLKIKTPVISLQSPVNRFIGLMLLIVSMTSISVAYAEPTDKAQWKTVDEAAAQVLTVDINTAGAEELSEVLIGVGESKAKAIIAFRNQNGPFGTAQDLLQVKGIGEATLVKNQDRIRL